MTLRTKARTFVNVLSDALNRSVCDGKRLNYIGSRDGSWGSIGFRLTRDDLVGQPIPLGITNHATSAYLFVALQVALESEDGYLKVTRATFGLYADANADRVMFHYDFDREKEQYPSAHLQVSGESPVLTEIDGNQGSTRQLGRLHFPVGGVRFRPCLEDVLEFLIVEGFVDPPRPGWQEALTTSRDAFRRTQLRAAVRRTPEPAVAQLEAMGYAVNPPPPE